MNAKRLLKITGILLIALFVSGRANAQQQVIVNGYTKDISGETINYHSCHPEANSALLVRCEDNSQFIEWETASAPAGAENVTFAWIAGYSSGTSNANHTFSLFVNGKRLLNFTSIAQGKPADWTVKGDENTGLRYKFEKIDGVKDQYGYMFLTLPRRLLNADGKVRLKITGDATKSRDWLMTFRYGYSEKITLVPLEALTHPINGKQTQQLKVGIDHFSTPVDYNITCEGKTLASGKLSFGINYISFSFPAVVAPEKKGLIITVDGKPQTQSFTLKPVRKMTVYILPHSHTDIGYTEIQTNIEKKQVNNLLEGIAYAKKTKDYPEGARFIWNVEVVWAADLFLKRMNKQQRDDFAAAVKDGSVSLNGMYLNTLTGICRPEELLRLFKFSTELSKKYNVKIDAAMMSDIPGNTWGTVTAMAQAGIKYFSTAPNYFDRIGDILVKWENKPFYWSSPSGKEKVLVWIPLKGYALSHSIGYLSADFVSSYTRDLEKTNYPYDIAYIRWSGHGDNAVPDPEICEFVKEWNAKYEWPRFIISSTSTAFSAFEKKYADKLPVMKGDWTGYWEDGAGSSALETGMNRNSSDRLTQAEALWSMSHPANYPLKKFEDAWRNVLLYSEHTWGADCSVTDPESQKTKEQWAIKKSYADSANRLSKELLQQALWPESKIASNVIDVINTTSWKRTDLVVVSPELSKAGNMVKDKEGNIIPSQRLNTRELAFVVHDVPPFASKQFTISAGKSEPFSSLNVKTTQLDNASLKINIDPIFGGISSIRLKGVNQNLVDSTAGNFVNDYLFLNGNKLADLQRNGPVKITIKEQGPVVASLLIESSAPGCNKLTREIQMVEGFDYFTMTNTVDKQRAQIVPKPGDYSFANTGGKESLNFGFPFNVKDGEMKLDVPLGVMRPELDQIPSACKNWLEVGRWADVSNKDYGITWATLDAPLVQVGGITAIMLGGQTNPAVWRKTIEPTQKLYSWAMNNHWETNYRAYQEGIVTFRYALRPHQKLVPVEATRFATGLTQPLVVAAAMNGTPVKSMLVLSAKNIVVLALKPSDDGKALMVTLFNSSDRNEKTALKWSTPMKKTSLSNTPEDSLKAMTGEVEVPAWEVVTLRAER
jgi:alpha-mannosidase